MHGSQERLCMSDHLPIVLVDEPAARKVGGMNIIELDINIIGDVKRFYIWFKDEPARLIDIARVAKLLSAKINQIVQREAVGRGFTIPCRRGCTACCHLLIILSAPEAIHLVEEVVAKMTAERRESILQFCSELGKQMREQLPKDLVANNTDNVSVSEIRDISDWYTRWQQPCAFLQDKACTVYKQRPIVCRDWLVLGSASQCQLGSTNKKMMAQAPVQLGNVLRQMASKLECTKPRGVFLHDIFTWYQANRELCQHTWPAKVLVEHFAEAVYEAEHFKPV